MTQRIGIVGASMAGLRAAQSLRAHGFEGDVVLIGDEDHRPYDRPPLSKGVLRGETALADIQLETGTSSGISGLDLQWRLGERVVSLDPRERKIVLAGGRTIDFDGLVVATGSSARCPEQWSHIRGVHVLRTIEDSLKLRDALARRPSKVAVIGAGFIGSEVASTCRGLRLDVALIDGLPAPMIRGLGRAVGEAWAAIHRDQGVDLRLGVSVRELEQDQSGAVTGVRLEDGSSVEAELVVVGVGAAPNTDWLRGSGLDVEDGLICDATCRVAPGIVAAGDVARWHHRVFGRLIRVEHWENAQTMGDHAAATLLTDLSGGVGEPYVPVPWFWTEQYGQRLQLAGHPSASAELAVVAGALSEKKFAAVYLDAGRVTGVVAMNMPAQVSKYRGAIAEAQLWADVRNGSATAG